MNKIKKLWWWCLTGGSAVEEGALITYDNTPLQTYSGTNLTTY